jgi:hypothetical protein
MPITQILRKLRNNDKESKASLSYIVRPCFKTSKQGIHINKSKYHLLSSSNRFYLYFLYYHVLHTVPFPLLSALTWVLTLYSFKEQQRQPVNMYPTHLEFFDSKIFSEPACMWMCICRSNVFGRMYGGKFFGTK